MITMAGPLGSILRCFASSRKVPSIANSRKCHFLYHIGSFDYGIFRRFSSSAQRDNPEDSPLGNPEFHLKGFCPDTYVTENGSKVVVSFDKEEQSTFHAPWLWSNDPSGVHPTSGQRLRTPGGYCSSTRIRSALIVNPTHEKKLDGVVLPFPPPPKGSSHPVGNLYEFKENLPTDALCLRVTWESAQQRQPQVSYYDIEWLRQWRYDDEAIETRRARTKITTFQALRSDGVIPTFDYKDMERDPEDFAFQLLAVSIE